MCTGSIPVVNQLTGQKNAEEQRKREQNAAAASTVQAAVRKKRGEASNKRNIARFNVGVAQGAAARKKSVGA